MAIKNREGLKEYPAYYEAWRAMHRRCYNATHPEYPLYGGQGVTVCPEWHFDNTKGYLNYINWIMEQPNSDKLKQGWVVSRVRIMGNFAPSNCDIVTRQVSSQRRRTVKLTQGIIVEVRRAVKEDPSITYESLVTKYGFGTKAFWCRMLKGKSWDNMNAFEQPVDKTALLKARKSVEDQRTKDVAACV